MIKAICFNFVQAVAESGMKNKVLAKFMSPVSCEVMPTTGELREGFMGIPLESVVCMFAAYVAMSAHFLCKPHSQLPLCLSASCSMESSWH